MCEWVRQSGRERKKDQIALFNAEVVELFEDYIDKTKWTHHLS